MKAENDEMALSNSDLEGLIREAYIVLDSVFQNADDVQGEVDALLAK